MAISWRDWCVVSYLFCSFFFLFFFLTMFFCWLLFVLFVFFLYCSFSFVVRSFFHIKNSFDLVRPPDKVKMVTYSYYCRDFWTPERDDLGMHTHMRVLSLSLSHNHTIIQPPQEADVVRGKKLANGNDQTVAIPSSFLLSLYLSSCSCPRYLMHVICTTMVSFSPQCSTISAPSDVQDPHSTSQSFSRVFDPL